MPEPLCLPRHFSVAQNRIENKNQLNQHINLQVPE